jgi:hypothetical protein
MAIAYQTEQETDTSVQLQAFKGKQSHYSSQEHIQQLIKIDEKLAELHNPDKAKLSISDRILGIFLGFLLPSQLLGACLNVIIMHNEKHVPMIWLMMFSLFFGLFCYFIFSVSDAIHHIGFGAHVRKKLKRAYQSDKKISSDKIYSLFSDTQYRFSLLESIDKLIEKKILPLNIKEQLIDIFVDNDKQRFLSFMIHIENLLQIQKNRFEQLSKKKEDENQKNKAKALFKESYRRFKAYKNPPIEVSAEEMAQELEEAFADIFSQHEQSLTQDIKHLL